MKLGIIAKNLDKDDLVTYIELFRQSLENWREESGDKAMPGPTAISLDILFCDYIKLSKMHRESDPKAYDKFKDNIQERADKIMIRWPRKQEKKPKDGVVPGCSTDEHEKQIVGYIVNGQRMSLEEYQNWYEALGPQEKIELSAHVKPIVE